MSKSKGSWIKVCAGAVAVTLVAVIIDFILSGLAPFGDRSLTYSDGQFQMLDLLCWYKDVLAGRSSIDYSFGKGLGGSPFAVFTYYLASPTSLLVVFFKKSQMPLLMNVIYAIKAMLAAGFTAYYLQHRFDTNSTLRRGAVIILSFSYALSPFFIAQSSNTMWLDGAYMLPLMLAGVEKIVANKRSYLFTITVALAILFNWYSGIIDLLAACFWLLYELARVHLIEPTNLKTKVLTIIRFGIASVIGVLMSCALLIPTLMMLSGRTHGKAGLSMLLDLGMIGPVSDVISNYSWGMISLQGSVSLFAGSFVLVGVAMLFVVGKAKLKEKILSGVVLLFTVMMFCWQPLVALFSMLRVVESYWYRYSYVGCFALIVLAAQFYLASERKQVKPVVPFVIGAIFAAVQVVLWLIMPGSTSDLVFAMSLGNILGVEPDYSLMPLISKVIFPVVIGSLISLLVYIINKQPKSKNVAAVTLAAVIAVELIAGQMVLTNFYSVENVEHIRNYVNNDLGLIPTQHEPHGTSLIRVLQTTAHSNHNNSFPVSYNEGMAYHFNSVTSFVSDPDENAIMFLDRAGYPQHSETITTTTQENLALDSLLSVWYVAVDYEDTNVMGLSEVDSIEGFKTLYRNIYALPPAFIYEGAGDYDSDADIPEVYLNDIYRELSGMDEDIFTPVNFTATRDGDTWTYTAPAVEGILYANFVTNTEDGATVYVNGDEFTRYADFLAPSQLRIPVNNQEARVEVVFDEGAASEDGTEAAEVTRATFYELNLDALERVGNEIRSRENVTCSVRERRVMFETHAHEGQRLFISIPYEEGWQITLNDEKITPDVFGSTFMSIPLVEGSNLILMHYKVPYKGEGMLVSLMGLLAFAACVVLEEKRLKC